VARVGSGQAEKGARCALQRGRQQSHTHNGKAAAPARQGVREPDVAADSLDARNGYRTIRPSRQMPRP